MNTEQYFLFKRMLNRLHVCFNSISFFLLLACKSQSLNLIISELLKLKYKIESAYMY